MYKQREYHKTLFLPHGSQVEDIKRLLGQSSWELARIENHSLLKPNVEVDKVRLKLINYVPLELFLQAAEMLWFADSSFATGRVFQQ